MLYVRITRTGLLFPPSDYDSGGLLMNKAILDQGNDLLKSIQTLHDWVLANRYLASAVIYPGPLSAAVLGSMHHCFTFQLTLEDGTMATRTIPIPDEMVKEILNRSFAHYSQKLKDTRKTFEDLR